MIVEVCQEDMMYEVKSEDPLAASFAGADEVAELRAGLADLRADLKARLDGVAIQAARPALAGAAPGGGAREVKGFVESYLRAGNLGGIEVKAVDGTAPATGGYAVPREIDAVIGQTLASVSPIRAIATVVKVGSAGYRKLVATGGVASGWASEDGVRGETATPVFAEVAPPMGDLFANPAATQAMLDDAAFDLENWLSDEIAREFARAEGAAFVAGDGVNKPRGFLTGPISTQDDGARPFGTIQYIATGTAGDFPTSDGADVLINLVHLLRSPYRQGASFVMNSTTLAMIRKMKDAEGGFLWQPGLVQGMPGTLLGYPVVEAEDMPDMAANSLSVAFGNFKAAYLIAEREETAILRDPYSHKPFVHFYATRRIGGAVANSEALKLVRFGVN